MPGTYHKNRIMILDWTIVYFFRTSSGSISFPVKTMFQEIFFSFYFFVPKEHPGDYLQLGSSALKDYENC